MKKLLTYVLLIVTCNVFGQIKPILEVETGYFEYTSSFSAGLSNITSEIHNYPMYSNIMLGAKYKKITVYQSIENWFGYTGGKSFSPYQIKYVTGICWEYKKIKLTYEHMCFHPVIASSKEQMEHYFFEAYDKLTVKIKLL